MVLHLSIVMNFNWLLITQDKMQYLFWSVNELKSANYFWHKLCVIITWLECQTHVDFKISGWLWRNFTGVLRFTQYTSHDDHHQWHKPLGKSVWRSPIWEIKPITQLTASKLFYTQVCCSSVAGHQNVERATCLLGVIGWFLSVFCVSVFNNCLCL